jgi:putative oxidoreductase
MSAPHAGSAEPRLLFPFLRPFYDLVVPLSWPLTRCAVGLILFVHGTGKLDRIVAFGDSLAKRGYVPGQFWGWTVFLTELVGGLCIALGLFTRFWAAAAAIELGVITLGYMDNGFSWTKRGYEYTLMWGLLLFAIALRGGGPYSIDRKIGREL